MPRIPGIHDLADMATGSGWTPLACSLKCRWNGVHGCLLVCMTPRRRFKQPPGPEQSHPWKMQTKPACRGRNRLCLPPPRGKACRTWCAQTICVEYRQSHGGMDVRCDAPRSSPAFARQGGAGNHKSKPVEATHQNYQAWGRRLPQTLLLTLPNRANGTRCARVRRGGRLRHPFFLLTNIEKFCLGVNSVTPKPFVSISFVSTGTKIWPCHHEFNNLDRE